MRTQIRDSVFETSSSSIHALCISTKNMKKCRIKPQQDGRVYVKLNQYYGCGNNDYNTQEQKLKYVCTWMFIYYRCDLDCLKQGYEWRKFVDAFCDYINNPETSACYNHDLHCTDIEVVPVLGYDAYDYLDHQSTPYGALDDEHCVVSLYRTVELLNFIFNPDIWLHTDID